MKPDKLPSLDPNVRGIFDRIITAVAEVRKERKSESYRQQEQRLALAEKTRHEARELEAQRQESARLAAERSAQLSAIKSVPKIIQAEDGLILREADRPKFVR